MLSEVLPNWDSMLVLPSLIGHVHGFQAYHSIYLVRRSGINQMGRIKGKIRSFRPFLLFL